MMVQKEYHRLGDDDLVFVLTKNDIVLWLFIFSCASVCKVLHFVNSFSASFTAFPFCFTSVFDVFLPPRARLRPKTNLPMFHPSIVV
jgi:hypothetical protein